MNPDINSEKKRLTVFIEGTGSEFIQGTITKEDLDNFKSSGLSWHEYCRIELELDGYWDVNNISHLTGITMDNAQLSIMIDEKEIWSGDYWSIFEENDEMTSNISSSEYGIMAKGDNEIPNTHVLISAMTSENLHAETSVVFDDSKQDFSLELPSDDNDGRFFINNFEFGFIIENTDGMGYGYDYGDYILGFIFDGKKYELEYPGGMGDPDIYVDKKPDWLK
tara:strand:- start:25 stop:690 length:666 start_codon:yes stop_codon:yes gene_type:complete